ncbi:hypothetical protein SV7mr_26820 [Stieleria bergensis]|uniref:Integrase SAM-like N-terminal domain-containing protein n=1 Tax=Stieleria bergensis TaxID=2528025 RepID=A0A517SVL2_9BACT|nr:hypothetical protein SV7mr_26820 [Planctomycetes bacterium SV_7m_r]
MMSHKKRSCPVTKRLAEDMTIRNMAQNTIDAYTYHVRCFGNFIKKTLDRVLDGDTPYAARALGNAIAREGHASRYR